MSTNPAVHAHYHTITPDQGEEDRRRTQEAINTVLAHLASAAVGLMSDPR